MSWGGSLWDVSAVVVINIVVLRLLLWFKDDMDKNENRDNKMFGEWSGIFRYSMLPRHCML